MSHMSHMPRPPLRRILLSALIAAAAIGGIYLLAPEVAGLRGTWGRLSRGDAHWLLIGGVLELASIGGYAVLFRAVIGRGAPRIDWRASLQIPLAGIAALRLLATGGAGGFAVTTWALGRAGMPARAIGSRIVAKLVVQYAIYMLALLICGLGLWSGLMPGGGSFAITVLPALGAAGVIVAALTVAALPAGVGATRPVAWLRERSRLPGWRGRPARALLSAATTLRGGVRAALGTMFAPGLGVLGALAYWTFDIAVLWCSFRAFGYSPAIAVVVMGYFLGTLAALLPLPGGIGGVEGGMIGAFLAFGLPAGAAVVAVLAYRAISFWLPTLPGVVGYLRLRATVHRWERADAARVGPTAPRGAGA